ncbi:MAG: hypothetical protein GX442_21565 [Candidatus Riflebacteria bacterium]|nr:hypothetical protein [Candidatus Riflebacteria bacterium]
MHTVVAHSCHPEGRAAVGEVRAAWAGHGKPAPHLVFFHASEGYDGAELMEEMARAFPGVPLHGGTSCQGIMTHLGALPGSGKSLGMLALNDPDGAYGVGVAPLAGDPRGAGSRAAQEALRQAGREGETPTMVWLTSAPGHEEEVLAGLEDLFGPDVPVGGGSAADDAVAGRWRQFANGQVFDDAVVVAVLFAPGRIGFSFHSGYDPTAKRAVITSGEGRTIRALDGRPAAEVYNAWTGGALADLQATGGSLLLRTTLQPLGRVAGRIGGIPYFQLSHPESMTADGALALFSRVESGQEVWLMQGSEESLVKRAGRVARSAVQSLPGRPVAVRGAMVIYCAGCMLTVRNRMADVVESLRQGLGPDVPFLGAFTFGEQGCFVGGENRHGNLMISLLVFAE